MPSHKASTPKEQSNISSLNQSPLISAKNVRRNSSLTIKLGLATSIAVVICLPIYGTVAAAKNLNSESGKTASFSNQFSTSPTSNSNTSQTKRSAFLPRIFSLITSPLRNKATNLADLAQATPNQQNSFLVGQVNNNLDSSYLKHQAISSLVANDYKSLALPSTPALAASSDFKIYKVKSGDTVEQIARKYQVSSAELVKLNSLKNANIIRIDRELKIPSKAIDSALYKADTNQRNVKLASTELSAKVLKDDGERLNRHNNSHDSANSTDDPYITKFRAEIEQLRNYRHQPQSKQQNTLNDAGASSVGGDDSEVQSIKTDDTATSIAAKHDLQPDLLDKDAIALQLPPLPPSEEYLPKVFNGYAWPAKGVLSSGYGWRWGRLHAGVDIAAPIGTPVVAAASGEVIEAGWNSGGYGNMIELQHLDGSVTLYAHNNRIMVNVGQRVNQGEQIAEMGSTGYSTGPHLHFEIHPKGQSAVDPMAFLNRTSLANVY
nr:peptidoglycan DD-metalloendopeptidase family protein [Pleurocapsa sp. FMAR1]